MIFNTSSFKITFMNGVFAN